MVLSLGSFIRLIIQMLVLSRIRGLPFASVYAGRLGYNGRAQGPAPTPASVTPCRGVPLWAPAVLLIICPETGEG
jgi:hypothetical protein